MADTYPFFSTWVDLAGNGYVEEEFYVDGLADAFAADGTALDDDVPYRTRIVVRRPARDRDFNGTVLMEWQNVTAGYDLDALWSPDHMMRSGYAWVGVSAQRVGVDQLRTWSPARYDSLDVTGGGAFVTDQLSYDIFAQAASAVRDPAGVAPLGDLTVDQVLAIGASQSAGRMRIYYDVVLPQVTPVFDGYAFIVGSAPTPRRSRARVPGPLRDRRPVGDRPAARQRRVPALGGRRHRALRLRRPGVPGAARRARPRRRHRPTSAATRRSAASRSARS